MNKETMVSPLYGILHSNKKLNPIICNEMIPTKSICPHRTNIMFSLNQSLGKSQNK